MQTELDGISKQFAKLLPQCLLPYILFPNT